METLCTFQWKIHLNPESLLSLIEVSTSTSVLHCTVGRLSRGLVQRQGHDSGKDLHNSVSNFLFEDNSGQEESTLTLHTRLNMMMAC